MKSLVVALAACLAASLLSPVQAQCTDCDGDGYVWPIDCNDLDPSIHPNAVEICDGHDNNCDLQVDEGCQASCQQPNNLTPNATLADLSLYDCVASWDGQNILVACSDGGHIYLLRMSEDLKVLTPPVEVASNTFLNLVPFNVIWNGAEVVVFYQDTRYAPSGGYYFARFNSDFSQIAPPVFLQLPISAFQLFLWNGNDYAIVWRSGVDIVIAILDKDGQVAVGPTVITSATSRYSTVLPSFLWTGQSYALVWTKADDEQFTGTVELSFLDEVGNRLQPDIALSLPGGVPLFAAPFATWVGDRIAVEWPQGTGCQYETVTAGGIPIQGPSAMSGDCHWPMIWTGSELASLQGTSLCRYSLLGALQAPCFQVDETGSAHVSTFQDVQLLWTGTHYATRWSDAFTEVGCTCEDHDGDGWCATRDCDDRNSSVHPYAAEVCNGIDDNCNGSVDENQGQITCGLGLCSRVVESCLQGVPQVCIPGAPSFDICDGLDNDCDGIADNGDADHDGYTSCIDCNDSDPLIHPSASERCNGIDDNCNGIVDEDASGVDSDQDGIHNACDNCRFAYNPTQQDTDHDSIGNACDNCVLVSNPNQADLDADGRGDVCDNCPSQYNPFQDDSDADGVGDVCDNCPTIANPDQADFDHDFEGDVCDLNDGLIMVDLPDALTVEWQLEQEFEEFDLYRGSLSVLKTSGMYTQDLDTVPVASRLCGLSSAWAEDLFEPPVGTGVFYLVTGVHSGIEGSLGTNSAGVERRNANPCP